MVVDAVRNEASSHSSGAPAARTGSPGDAGATCKNCHAGPTPIVESGWITSNIPSAGYTGGQTYTITATITRSGHSKFGFEVSPQNPTGTLLGTLITTNTTETQLVGTSKYITHKTAGTAGANARTWTFNWTAPVAGTGNVTFYGAFLATNSGNNSSGDTTFTSTLLVSECTPPAQPGTISGNAVICTSSSSTLTYSVLPVAGATSYNWTFPAGWTVLTTQSNSMDVLAGTTGGAISVTASNSCGTSASSALVVTLDQLSVSATSTIVSCNGGTNGTATATPSAGVAPYTYSWTGGGNAAINYNLAAGTYTATVTDAIGCTNIASTTITEPLQIVLNTTSTNAYCGNSNGSVTVFASGGTPGYAYSWSPGNAMTATMTNISSGNYTVTVTDVNGCMESANVAVANVSGPTATISSSTNVSCNGGTDGSATVTLTGGSAPFTYLWTGGGGTGATANNLSAGNYSVTVTDANGCLATSIVTISEPLPISLITASTDAACSQSNGSASVIVSGGTAGYIYSWNSSPVQTTDTAINLSAGYYTVTVTDAHGCSASVSVGVSNSTGPIVGIGTIINVSCFGGSDGSLFITVGNNANYTYLWLPFGGNDTIATNLSVGTYSVTVTDSLGCRTVITADISEPPLLVADAGFDISICDGAGPVIGGAIPAIGGTFPYFYSWSPAGDLNSANLPNPVATPSQTTIFTLTVTDAHGCISTSDVTVTVNPLPVVPVISINNDVLYSTPAGYYQWYLNGTIINGATSQSYAPLQNGNYTVVISDSNSCEATSTPYSYNSAGIEEGVISSDISIYPNPVGDEFTVLFLKITTGEIEIVNALGEMVYSDVLNNKQKTINCKSFPAGIYFLKISANEKSFTKLLVKQF